MKPSTRQLGSVTAGILFSMFTLPALAVGERPAIATHSTVGTDQSATLKLQQIGTGDFRFGIFGRIYSATLYAPLGLHRNELLRASVPKQLELRYHTSVSRSQIASSAERKIRQQRGASTLSSIKSVLDIWHQAMRDVREGDSYLMSYAEGELEMRLNGEVLVSLKAPALAEAYFGIWLDDDPISESLRDALLDGLTAGQELARDDRG